MFYRLHSVLLSIMKNKTKPVFVDSASDGLNPGGHKETWLFTQYFITVIQKDRTSCCIKLLSYGAATVAVRYILYI